MITSRSYACPHPFPSFISYEDIAPASIKLLYLLSTDPSLARSYARYLPSVAGPLISFILSYPDYVADPAACALLVNLSAAPALVPALLHGNAVDALMRRLLATHDGGLLRAVRALSQHKAARPALEPYAMAIAEIVLKGDRPDLRIEALGVLVNTPLNKVLLQPHRLFYHYFFLSYSLTSFCYSSSPRTGRLRHPGDPLPAVGLPHPEHRPHGGVRRRHPAHGPARVHARRGRAHRGAHHSAKARYSP